MLNKLALVIGPRISGPGVSVSFGKFLRDNGYKVAIASQDIEKLKPIAQSIGADSFHVDADDNDSIVNLFKSVDKFYGGASLDVVSYSCLYSHSSGFKLKGEVGTIDYSAVAPALQGSAIGALVVGHEAGKRMVPHGKGAIFFTGTSASTDSILYRPAFSMGKFAQRALAQSLYKELSPKGIHVCHVIVDGAIKEPTGDENVDRHEFTADAIAGSFMSILSQPPGAWTWEIELRSKNEEI
jgi:NAD(P)-dependent dehydrogenase (short-subunit alcohol dehydrogenase family)